MIPLSEPDLSGNEAAYLARCVADNWVSSVGPEVTEFEHRMARLSGAVHGVATVNGTAALHLALVSAGVGPGDRVIVPDWTFAATANAVLHAGAQPVFVDVNEESWSIDTQIVEDLLQDNSGGPIAAVIAVHVLGHPADIDPLKKRCAEAGVHLIEDAAGAIGARYRDRPVGGLGDVAVFSFNGNKTVTAGGGGMIVTDNTAWAAKAKALATQSRDGAAYRYNGVGFNYRMPNLNAALGLAQLERLDAMLKAKRGIAARYDQALADRGDLQPMPRCAWAESACWLYSVRCASRDAAAGLVTYLHEGGAQARTFWEALSTQEPYQDAESHGTGVAAGLSGTVVSLPCSSNLGEADQNRVIELLAGWRDRDIGAAA